MQTESPYIQMLEDRVNLRHIPFTDCGSRLLVYQDEGGLSIRLAAQREQSRPGPALEPACPPLVQCLAFTDGDGNPLPVRFTTYPHCIECHTPLGDFSLTFQDSESLLLIPPAAGSAAWGVCFEVQAAQAQADALGGIIHVDGPIHLIYTTNAQVRRSWITPLQDERQEVHLTAQSQAGDSLLLHITARRQTGRYLPDPAEAQQAAEQRWRAWFTAAPIVSGPLQNHYYYAWWALRAGLTAAQAFRGPAPSQAGEFQYLGISDWNVYFLALAYRHVDRDLAQNQVRSLLAEPQSLPSVRPPMAAWTVWKLYTFHRDRDFLEDVYAPLVQGNRWWFDHNDRDRNGLCEYPAALAMAFGINPLWEGRPSRSGAEGAFSEAWIETPELNTCLYLQQEALGRIAAELGRPEEARNWARRAEKTARRMLDMQWDHQAGMFWPRSQGRAIQARTPLSLLPLLTGRLPQPVIARLVANLTDPQQFWTPHPVPSLARSDPRFDPSQKGRGATWGSINYLLIEGLKRSGLGGLSSELRRRTLEMIAAQPDIFEVYHPLTGENVGRGEPVFPWSSAIFVELAIQDEYERCKIRSNSLSPQLRWATV